MSKFEVADLKKRPESKKDINSAFRNFEEPECFLSSTMRRAAGSLELKDDIVAKLTQGLISTLGFVKGFLLQDLFADKAVYPIKRDQLARLGTTEARLKDAQGEIFWARLTKKKDSILLEDIDIEKNFELECEDLLEEQERTISLSAEIPAYQ